MSLPNFPAVLFYRGDPSCLKSKSIFAVIGTRNPSDYGKMACKTIVEDLAANGSVIVSGGALGIDSAAHSTCVEAGAKTVLVSGTGIDSDYPKQNSELREAIASHGCIISEYAPGSGASHSSFPLRNRIVAALSMAIIVFEAGEKSGTLNTCGHAKKLGKPIFVLPGAIDSELYIGSNRLIDEGAVPLFSAEMVYRYFDMKLDSGREAPQGRTPFSGINTFTETPGLPAGVSRTERLAKAAQKRKSGSENTPAKEDEALVEEAFENEAEASAPAFDPGLLSPNAAVVFAAIKNGSVNLDSIVRESGLAAHLVMRELSELEMEGAVEKINSLEYKIK